MDKKFDIILSNPPFNGELHLKFLEKYFDIADKVVIIEPSTWLINIKNNITKDEIKLIDHTISKYDRKNKWFKAYMTGEE